ncbi:SAM-dependent methyltransferase [Nocardia colli]|uniref:S-adenosyl-L-methionine-dependent methyltransferase n=1 Tax=Nocardia colli TaxID=2545717 RepID=A0A5N0DYS7_9NOCA|nr:SAM-dependent methyltransferase [Nocardia colli]KAA8881853.1 SAM-dependent methyltransferase [Nocardia colli]
MRTESGPWDIGRTALLVALERAMAAAQVESLACDEYSGWFLAAAGAPEISRLTECPELLSESMLTSVVAGFRTKFLDDFSLSASADGIQQVVLLAAGFDARAYRLDWAPGSVVYEIDVASTQQFKRQVLTEHNAIPRALRWEVTADPLDDWTSPLLAAAFDPAAPTAWLTEGLLTHLPTTLQSSLFEQVDMLSAAGSRFAADISDSPDASYYPDHRLTRRSTAATWFASHGWTATGNTLQDLATRFDRVLPAFPEALRPMFDNLKYLATEK